MSPAARLRARELGIDVEGLAGTGPHGAVTLEDVLLAAEHRAPASSDRGAEMRRAIAAAMSRSKREIPHYYLSETIPMVRAAEWLARDNEQRPVTGRLLMGVLQLKAVALALREVPQLNGFWRDGAFQAAAGVHIGVAISLRQGGLIAPALHDVATKDLVELMRELSDLVKRARAGLAAQLRDVRSDDHGDQSRRPGNRSGVRRDLSSAGRAGGIRPNGGETVDRKRTCRARRRSRLPASPPTIGRVTGTAARAS